MRTTFSIDDDLHESVRKLAFDSRRSMSEIINELLAAGLKASTAKPPTRKLGQFEGSITIADDFDETPPEVLDAFEEQLGEFKA